MVKNIVLKRKHGCDIFCDISARITISEKTSCISFRYEKHVEIVQLHGIMHESLLNYLDDGDTILIDESRKYCFVCKWSKVKDKIKFGNWLKSKEKH